MSAFEFSFGLTTWGGLMKTSLETGSLANTLLYTKKLLIEAINKNKQIIFFLKE